MRTARTWISLASCIALLLILSAAGRAADPSSPAPRLKANQRAHPPSGMSMDAGLNRTAAGPSSATLRQSGGPNALDYRPVDTLHRPSLPPGPVIAKPKPAPGEIPDVPPGLILKALDLNRDDALTSTELRNTPALFKKLDTNGDGVIRWDLTGADPRRKRKSAESVQGVFRRMDKNGDGKLNLVQGTNMPSSITWDAALILTKTSQ